MPTLCSKVMLNSLFEAMKLREQGKEIAWKMKGKRGKSQENSRIMIAKMTRLTKKSLSRWPKVPECQLGENTSWRWEGKIGVSLTSSTMGT